MRSTQLSLALLLFGACGCPDAPHRTQEVSFAGIKGTLYHEDLVCGADSCAARVGDTGIVRVLQEGVLVVENRTADDGGFDLLLAPGTYSLELAIPTAPVDRALDVVTVSDTRGLEIVRTYEDDFAPDRLALVFEDTVAPSRRSDIIEAHFLETIYSHGTYVRVLIPPEAHPQLLGEALVALYPDEIEGYELFYTECGG